MRIFAEYAVKHKEIPFSVNFREERSGLYFLQKPATFQVKTHSKTVFDCINSLFQVTERIFHGLECTFRDLEYTFRDLE